MFGGDTQLSGRSRGWHVFGLVVSILAAGFFALAGLGGVLGAAGSASQRVRAGQTFGSDVATAVICSLIALVFIAAAVHFEHQLRRHQPAARSWAEPTAGPPFLGFPGRRRSRRYAPWTAAIEAVVLTALFVGFLVGAVVTHADGERSSRVQQDGIRRAAAVLQVSNHWHSSRYGGYYTADVTMSLMPPIGGVLETVVHYPGAVHAQPGTEYQVLVDPRQPGYAEFPGAPSTRSSAWIVELVFAVVFGLLDGLLAWYLVRLRRRRKSA